MSYPAAFGYNGDGVDGVYKKIRLNKNIPAKRDAPINSWINTVTSPVIHDHTSQLASPPNTPHLSRMSYPDVYGYNGDGADGVDMKIRLNKNIPAKIYAPINLLRNMASKLFNWECTLPFNRTPRTEKRPL
jgi:hypothetical protein